MGSKNRIAKYIIPIMLNERKDDQFYVEPFCGGCNLIDKVSGNRIASDKNKYLIAMFKSLYENRSILLYTSHIDRDLYNDVRESMKKNDCKYSDAFIGWVGFMASYNGKFFDGGYSGHNVKGRDYISEQIKNTLRQINNIKQTSLYNEFNFISSDYRDLVIPEKSIIYCDIPYKNTTKYITSSDFNYEIFYEWCHIQKNNGHTIFISEYNMPEEFKCVWEMEITNSLSLKNTHKNTEKLYTL